jgi:hypothetical protein
MQWSEQCPARGAGLTHAHWRECRPEHGGHPSTDPTTEYAGRHHAYDQCCHCEERIERAATVQEQPVQAIRDHAYLPTMSGWCAKCRQPQKDHEAQVHLPTRDAIHEQAEEFALPKECTVDHNSISRKQLIGDGGWVWSSCPSCGVQLEGKFYTGNYSPRQSGHGRGEATPRFLKRVEAYVGWFAHLFGNAS